MGKSPEAIPNRLERGEPADAVIMVGYALDDLIKQGKVIPGSRVELADSRIGMVVRDGAPKPDIGSETALKETLLHARSIAYSDSASGVYIERELFKRLGIEEQVKSKAKMIPKIPVASVVASGDYEMGFQQVSELLAGEGRGVRRQDSGIDAVRHALRGGNTGWRAASEGSEGAARLSRVACRAARSDIDRARFRRHALRGAGKRFCGPGRFRAG